MNLLDGFESMGFETLPCKGGHIELEIEPHPFNDLTAWYPSMERKPMDVVFFVGVRSTRVEMDPSPNFGNVAELDFQVERFLVKDLALKQDKWLDAV